jgi:hypothetical protein
MSLIRQAIIVAGVASTIARHPVVRAGVALAPRLITPQVKARARDTALDAAYQAGVVARKLLKKR